MTTETDAALALLKNTIEDLTAAVAGRDVTILNQDREIAALKAAVPPPAPAPALIRAGDGRTLADFMGRVMGITAAGQVTIDGQIDTATHDVRQGFLNGQGRFVQQTSDPDRQWVYASLGAFTAGQGWQAQPRTPAPGEAAPDPLPAPPGGSHIGICIDAAHPGWTASAVDALVKVVQGPIRVSFGYQLGAGAPSFADSHAAELVDWLIARGRTVEICTAFRDYAKAGPNYDPWLAEGLAQLRDAARFVKARGYTPAQVRLYGFNEPRGDIAHFRDVIAPQAAQAVHDILPAHELVLGIANDDDPDPQQNWNWYEPLRDGSFPGYGALTRVAFHWYTDYSPTGAEFTGQGQFGTYAGVKTGIALPSAFTAAKVLADWRAIKATADARGFVVECNEAGAARYAPKADRLIFLRALTAAARDTGIDLFLFAGRPPGVTSDFSIDYLDPDYQSLFF